MTEERGADAERAADDAEFRRAVRARSPAAWARLMVLYDPLLQRQAARLLPERLDPENAVAEVWFRAVLTVRRYDAGRSPLPWLARICANFCFNVRRGPRAKPPERLDESLAGPVRAPAEPPDAQRAAFADALASLPEREREVVTLRYLFELPVREIAVLLGLAPNTVDHAVFDGVERLRNGPAAVALAEWTEIGNLEGIEGVKP